METNTKKAGIGSLLKNKLIIIPSVIGVLVIAAAGFGYYQYQQFQTRQDIIMTHNLLVTYLEEVSDVDEQVEEFENLSAIDSSNYKTNLRRFNDEYERMLTELEEVTTAREALFVQLDENDTNLDTYSTLIREVDTLTSEEFIVVEELMTSTKKYTEFFAKMQDSDAFDMMDSDAETPEEVIAAMKSLGDEFQALRDELATLKDEPYYEDVNAAFDTFLAAAVTFTEEMVVAVETLDPSKIESALLTFAESVEDMEQLDLYAFEKVIDESDERADEINALYQEIREEETRLVEQYNIDTGEEGIEPANFKKTKIDDTLDFGNGYTEEPAASFGI